MGCLTGWLAGSTRSAVGGTASSHKSTNRATGSGAQKKEYASKQALGQQYPSLCL